MVLTTPRLILRPLEDADAQALWPYVADPAISRYMSWEPHESLDETRAFVSDVVSRMNDGATIAWVITLRDADTVIGLVSLLGIVRTHRALRYDKAELAYWIGGPFQGNGYATEAGDAVLGYAFREMGLNKVTVAHDEINDASRRLIERLHFRRIGVERNHFYKNGRWVNHVIYELLSSDYDGTP